MSITLDSLSLPDNLTWIDEFDWTPVAQAVAYLESGHLEVQESLRLAGQPITLGSAWAPRSLVLSLRAMQADAGAAPMTLTLNDGSSHSVIWRRDGGGPMVARPVSGPLTQYSAEDHYQLTLYFLKV